MGMRLGVATLLLGGTLLITLEGDRGFEAFTPRFLVALIALIYGATLVFSVWLLGSSRRDHVAIAQVATDLLVTTGLVYVTGGPSSGFTFLYGVAVLMAAMVIGPRAARVVGAIAVVFYGTLAVSLSSGWMMRPPDQRVDAYALSPAELVYTGLLNALGLLLVTLLASTLAARALRTGGRLKLIEASAATLARLNDDIVRSLSSGVISTDLEGRVRTINPAGLEMFATDGASLLGRPITTLFETDPAGVLHRLGTSESSVLRVDTTAIAPDGRRFPVGCSMNPLVDAGGNALGALVLFQDLSEIVRLRDAAARADRLAVLGRLSAGLAHEIRNPLGSISGSVQLVRESKSLDPEESRLLGIVLDEVERLDDLVSTMLQMGRPRDPQRRSVDLRETVDAVVEMARRGPARTKGVAIEADVPGHAAMAFVDADQIRQVLWNLVKNALEASPKGRTVRVRLYQGRDAQAVVAVSDQGRGLDAMEEERVRNAFHSERTHGAGIGLALVRQIVDAHGASIEIHSAEREGATFTVTFPPVPAAKAV
jgi:two-component system sensor histidine kinase PilS (NtrC family)